MLRIASHILIGAIAIVGIAIFEFHEMRKLNPQPFGGESCETLGKYCAEFESRIEDQRNPQLALKETDAIFGATDLNHIIAGTLWQCSPGFGHTRNPEWIAQIECRTYCTRLDHDPDKIAAALRDECGVEQ